MKIQVVVCWVVSLCSDVVGYQHFGGPCQLHLQGGNLPRDYTVSEDIYSV